MTTVKLRPSQFPSDGTATLHGETIVGIRFVKGGVRVATRDPDGVRHEGHYNGRRKYPVTVTPKEGT